MKIGIITLNGFYNYGNRLQNYALQRVCLKFTNDVETIWYDSNNYFLDTKTKHSAKNIVKYIMDWRGFRKYKKYELELLRQYNIKNFTDMYINTNYLYGIDKKKLDKYDYFIVGSDQVWNPKFAAHEAEFLMFAPQEKRIAYAASIGIKDLPNQHKGQMKKGLQGMNYISVREKAGADIIYQLTGKNVEVLVDPTLLLNKKEWQAIAKRPSWYRDERYILTYFLGDIPDVVTRELDRLAREQKLKIYNMMDTKNRDTYISRPDEFLYLIEHSTLLYTDSFHGTVFSILMKIPFVVCERVEKGMENMTSRLDNLLQLFNLELRRGTRSNGYIIENPLKINYLDVEKTLDVERLRSENYLRKAMGL